MSQLEQAPSRARTVEDAVCRIRAWGEANEWRGYDPYDGLNSPFAPVVTLGTRFGRRLLTQAVKRSPVNLRPALRIERGWNAKGVGLVVSGYAHLWSATHDEAARAQAVRWLDWLDDNPADTGRGRGWGYHFDVQTRFFFYGRNSPNTIATSFVARAFLDAATLLGEDRWVEAARDAARFLADEMLVTRREGPFFRYIPGDTQVVHNANLLACEVLARTAKAVGGDARFEQIVREALDTTLRAQRDDGSWPYAENQHGWVDNFHTGYVLEALAACAHLHGEAPERLDAGVDFWARELFLRDGRPKFFPDHARPLDAHNYAQAISTWLAVADRKPEAGERCEQLVELLIDDLLAADGYVYVEPRRRVSNTVPYIRWSTAPSFAALAALQAFNAQKDLDSSSYVAAARTP